MKTLAAVLVKPGTPLVLEELEIPALKSGQVLVEVAYAGICHTQLLECRGHRGEDRYLPHCLGHEGSGCVREVGPEVTKVRQGDPVILTWMKGGGAEVAGTTYRCNSRFVNAGAITTFSKYTVVSENRLIPLLENIPLNKAALLGCALPTGMGAVFNTAAPKPGQSLAVFGAGGVGLFSIAAAALSSSHPVIAIDIQDQKLKLAQSMGASHTINASKDDPLTEIKLLAPEGLDFAIEATGRPAVMRQALECVRPQGGNAIVIGNAPYGEECRLDPRQFNLGKRLLGTWGGDNVPDRDFPRYAQLLSAGKLNVDAFIEHLYSLQQINDALDDLENGSAVRPLIQMES